MTTDDRSAKRLRLSDHLHSLLPDGTSPTATTQQPTFQPSLHMNSDSTAAFSHQYHWPAEPSTSSSIDQTSGGIPGLGGMGLPPLPGNAGGGIGVNSPGLTGVRFTDDTLNSASTGGDAIVNVLDPSITGTDLGKPPSTAQILAARSSNGNTGYADLIQSDSALSPNLSNAGIPTGNGINTAGSKKTSATSDVDDNDDENPSPKPTPFSRTPELKVHHKLAERQRRKEMKDLFDELRELLPTERGTKSSKWEILKKAIGYIEQMKQRESDSVAETERLKREVEMLSGGPTGGYGINMSGGGVSDLTVGAALSGLGVEHQEQDQTATGGGIGVGMGGNGQVEIGKGEQ